MIKSYLQISIKVFENQFDHPIPPAGRSKSIFFTPFREPDK